MRVCGTYEEKTRQKKQPQTSKETDMKNFIPHWGKTVRGLMAIVTVCMFVGLASIPAWADSPHYLRAAVSLDSDTACYSVTIKEAGLGNSGFSELTYSLTCDAQFTVACVTGNKKKHVVQGQPKSGETELTGQTTLPITNGQTNGTISLCPAAEDLPDPGCTGNQIEVILAASYSNCELDDSLGTASPTLGNRSAGSLFVVVE
jgi:hypothetical protein